MKNKLILLIIGMLLFIPIVSAYNFSGQWSPTGLSYSLFMGPEAWGLYWDNNNWFVTSHVLAGIQKYDSSWNYITGFPGGSNYLGDITTDGTYWYITEYATGQVRKYDLSWTYLSVFINDVSAGTGGITWDGTNFWISNYNTNLVYKYTSAGVYTGTSYNVGGQDDLPYSIYWDGTSFWMGGATNNRLYKYNSVWTYTGESFPITGVGGITGIGKKDDYWYTLQGGNSIYKYYSLNQSAWIRNLNTKKINTTKWVNITGWVPSHTGYSEEDYNLTMVSGFSWQQTGGQIPGDGYAQVTFNDSLTNNTVLTFHSEDIYTWFSTGHYSASAYVNFNIVNDSRIDNGLNKNITQDLYMLWDGSDQSHTSRTTYFWTNNNISIFRNDTGYIWMVNPDNGTKIAVTSSPVSEDNMLRITTYATGSCSCSSESCGNMCGANVHLYIDNINISKTSTEIIPIYDSNLGGICTNTSTEVICTGTLTSTNSTGSFLITNLPTYFISANVRNVYGKLNITINNSLSILNSIFDVNGSSGSSGSSASGCGCIDLTGGNGNTGNSSKLYIKSTQSIIFNNSKIFAVAGSGGNGGGTTGGICPFPHDASYQSTGGTGGNGGISTEKILCDNCPVTYINTTNLQSNGDYGLGGTADGCCVGVVGSCAGKLHNGSLGTAGIKPTNFFNGSALIFRGLNTSIWRLGIDGIGGVDGYNTFLIQNTIIFDSFNISTTNSGTVNIFNLTSSTSSGFNYTNTTFTNIFYLNHGIGFLYNNDSTLDRTKLIFQDGTVPYLTTNIINNTWSNLSIIDFILSWISSSLPQNATLYIYNSTGGNVVTNTSNLTGNPGIFDWLTNLIDGVYSWFITFFDISGNNNMTGNYTLYVDTKIPEIEFIEYTTNVTYLTTSFNDIIANVSANDTNINYIIINLYNTTGLYIFNTTVTYDYGDKKIVEANFSNLPQGIYYLSATIYDNASNSNSTDTRAIYIDSSPPTVNITYPLNDSIAFNDSFNVETYDLITGVKEVLFDINSEDTGIQYNKTINESSGNYTWNVDIPDGHYNMTVNTTNNAGLINNSNYIFFTYVSTPPAIWYNDNTINNGIYNITSFVVNVSMSDPYLINHTTIYVYLKNILYTTAINDSGNNTLFANFTYLLEGNYTVYATTWGNSGLSNTTAIRNILIDTTSPYVNITAPLNNSYTNNPNVNFSSNVGDNTLLANATLFVYNSTGGLYVKIFTGFNQTDLPKLDPNYRNIVDWRIDGESIALLNLPFDSNNSAGDGITKDYSTYGNNGTIGDAIWNATGGHNGFGAYDFVTTSNITFNPGIYLSNNYTISMWIYPRPSSEVYASLFAYAANNGLYYLGLERKLNFFDGGDQKSSTAITENMWHHIVIINSYGNITFYVDGVKDGNDTISPYDFNATVMGDDATHEYFNGVIDDVLVFNRSLSSDQVSLLASSRLDVMAQAERDPGENWSVCVTQNNGSIDVYNKCSDQFIDKSDDTFTWLYEYLVSTIFNFIDDVYTYFWEVVDYAGQMFNTSGTTFTVDTIFPIIYFQNSMNVSGMYNMSNITMNVSVIDINLNHTNVELWNITGGLVERKVFLNGTGGAINTTSVANIGGLFLYYESSNGIDSSLYGNNATYNNVTSLESQYCKHGSCMNYGDGWPKATYRKGNISGASVGNQPFTVTFWMNASTGYVPTGRNMPFKMGTNQNKQAINLAYWLPGATSGDGNFCAIYFGINIANALCGGNFTIGNWTFVTLRYNGSTMELFQNAVLMNKSEIFNPLNLFGGNSSNDEGTIGIGWPVWEYGFHGSVDELKVFNRSVTDEELSILYTGNNTAGAQEFYYNFTGLIDGWYFLNATAFDKVPNIAYTETRWYGLDTTPPEVSNVTPTILNIDVITNFNVTIKDNTSGVSLCRLYLNDTYLGLMDYNYATNQANYSTDFHTYGTWEMYANCSDSIGWTTEKSGLTTIITKDATPPEVKNVYPNGQYYNISDIITNISANVTDNVGLLLNVSAIITYPNGITTENITFTNISEIWNGTFTIPITQKGRYNITIIANDTAGNINSSMRGYFIATDFIPPKVHFEYPETTLNGTNGQNWIDANITVNDTVGIDSVFIYVFDPTGVAVQTYSWASPTYNESEPVYYNFTGLTDNWYTLGAWVNDTSGNANMTNTSVILIHAQGTLINPMTPPNNTYSTNLSWNISMNYSSSINVSNATLHITNVSGGNEINTTFFDLSDTLSGTVSTIFDFFNGVFTWFFDIFDILGNINVTENRTLTLDNETPVIDTNFSNNAAYLRGLNITEQFNFSTNGSYLDNYKITIDGSNIITNTINVNNVLAQYNLSWNTTNLENNNHTLTVFVQNAGNLSNAIKTFNFSIQDVPNFVTLWPNNATQLNTVLVNFNATINTSWYNLSCNVTLNSDDVTNIGSLVNTNSINSTYSIPNIVVTDGNNTYNMTCSNSVGSTDSQTYFFYEDTDSPRVNITTFVSLRPYLNGENISAQFNLSDNLILYSYNFSIDNEQIKYNNTLSDLGANQNVTVQLDYPTTNYSPGAHILGLRIADGHTANKLQNKYVFDTGAMIADGLTISITEPNKDERGVKIKNMKGSMSDKYEIIQETDRYSYIYTPKTFDSQYEFMVTSDTEISILRAHDTPYQEWIVTGNNWIDFLLENQPNEKVTITKIDDRNVKVLITGLNFKDNNKDKQKFNERSLKFHSIGELNAVQYNYTFFTYNATITDYTSVVNNAQYYGYIQFNKGNDTFFASNVNRAYNLTPILNATGTIVTNQTTPPIYEYWKVLYTTPIINMEAGTTRFDVNYSWKIGAYNHSINFTQLIIPLGIGNCSNDSWAKAITFTLADEDFSTNISKYVNSTLNIWLEVHPVGTVSGGAVNVSIAFTGGWNYSICILPNSSVAVGNSIMEYYAPEYANRKYYLLNINLTNVTTYIPLYLVNFTKASNIQMKVYDKSTGAAVSGAYIQVLRYYPELGAYRTVEIEKTDDTGYAVGKLIPYDVFYRFNVIFQGQLKLESQLQTIYTTTKLLPISLSEDVLHSFQYIGAIAQNTTCDINTRTCTFVWSDVTGLTQDANLKIWKVTSWGKNLIYEQQVASTAGAMFYTVPMTENMNGTTYIAEGSIETNTANSKYIMSRDQMMYNSGLGIWGGVETVLYGMMLVVVALGFIFIDLGPAGLISGTLVALIFGAWMGWIPLLYPAMVSLCIIGGIIISKIRYG